MFTSRNTPATVMPSTYPLQMQTRVSPGLPFEPVTRMAPTMPTMTRIHPVVVAAAE